MNVIDLHCDTLSAMCDSALAGKHIEFGKNSLHIDLDKLKRGHYLLQCFAMYVDLHSDKHPLVNALEQFDLFREILTQYSGDIAQVKTWSDLEKNRKEHKISAVLTAEEGGLCAGSLSVLRTFYLLGVRIMTLTWNYENDLAWPNEVPGSISSVYPCKANTEKGLKEKGFAFIEEMERLGILIDVSHLSDAGFWDVCRNTTRPFVATHSNVRALCGHVRNLTDDMIRAIADRGGIIGLNYCSSFLDPSEHPRSTVKRIAEHAAYLRNLCGIDCIALGSDFDGIEGDLEMRDASCLPLLEAELRRQQFTETEIEKIFCGNALRLLKEILPA